MKFLFILGLPFVGKTTLISNLEKYYCVKYKSIKIGQILRNKIALKTVDNEEIENNQSGHPAKETTIEKIILDSIYELEKENKKDQIVLIDGFPRFYFNFNLLKIFKRFDTYALMLKLPKKDIIKRFKDKKRFFCWNCKIDTNAHVCNICGKVGSIRTDDSSEKMFLNRMNTTVQHIRFFIDYFKVRKHIKIINYKKDNIELINRIITDLPYKGM